MSHSVPSALLINPAARRQHAYRWTAQSIQLNGAPLWPFFVDATCTQALDLDEDHVLALETLADLLLEVGGEGAVEAAAIYGHILTIDPEHTAARDYLAGLDGDGDGSDATLAPEPAA